jgi:zinc/manganese transport system permease protein
VIELLFDPLFRIPLLTGLLLAPLAGLVGACLRLRREWLASLAYAQVAAAGGVLGSLVLFGPALVWAVVLAGAAAAVKAALARAGNDSYALLLLLGWSIAMVAAARGAHGESIARSLMEGQLYFVGADHLLAAVALAAAAAVLLPWLSPRLLRERLFPEFFPANAVPGWPHALGFDALVVFTVAVLTTAMGVMAAFALLFVPAWIIFPLAGSWQRALWASALLALTAYAAAFAAALALDLPFAPVLTLALVLIAPLRLLGLKTSRSSAAR